MRLTSLSVTVLVLMACGDSKSTFAVDVQFPASGVGDASASLHLWVLSPNDEAATCAALITESVGPYDPSFSLLADTVFLQPEAPTPTAEEIRNGRALLYLEAVDFAGVTLLAGCTDVSIGSADLITVFMSPPGTFACADPATEAGAPCSSGDLCTDGETCSAGACSGGGPRDCSAVADQCNTPLCDDAVGCATSPLPNGTTCDDNLFCSDGDTCSSGFCTGPQRDCSAASDQCNVGVCNEGLDACVPVPVSGACVDADVCTMGEACVDGQCVGGVVTDLDGDGYSPTGCPDGAIGSGDCDDDAILVNPGATEGPVGDPTCMDGDDNDCDGMTDGMDDNC